MDWRFVLSLLFAVIVAIFAIQNADAVEVEFFTINITISQALIILISAVFGAITVMLFGLVRWVKLRSKVKSLTKTITILEEENRVLEQRLKTNKVAHADKVAQADEVAQADNVIPIHQAEKNLDEN